MKVIILLPSTEGVHWCYLISWHKPTYFYKTQLKPTFFKLTCILFVVLKDVYFLEITKWQRGIDKDGRGARVIVHVLVHSPNSYNSWVWASLKSESWNSLWVSHMGIMGPSTWIIIHCLPRCMYRELDLKVKQQGLELDYDMGYLRHRWWLNPLCQNVSPRDRL